MKYFDWRSPAHALLEGPSKIIDEPISAEIFSVERLEHHAESLARSQEVWPAQTAGISLHGRLRANAQGLDAAFHTLITGIRLGQAVTPAAEWLVDNYYIVDEHLHAVRRDLPPGFYKQLPKLSNGPLRGYPRVYGLAWEIVAHTDSRFEPDALLRFCRAYQRIQPLTIGELWALAITLRVVLIENLGRLAAGIVSRLRLRERANALADKMLPDAAHPGAPVAAAPQMADSRPLPLAFAAQLFQRLRDHDPETTPALTWLHRTLAAQNTTADDIVHGEHQRQGGSQPERTQHHHQFAPHFLGRLGQVLRKRQPRRRTDARAKRVRSVRFLDPRPVPACHRRSGAPLAALGNRGGSPCARRRQTRRRTRRRERRHGWTSARARARLLPRRRRARGVGGATWTTAYR